MSDKTVIKNDGTAETISRDMVEGATIKIYSGFDKGVFVGAQIDGETHKEYSQTGTGIVLDNGLA